MTKEQWTRIRHFGPEEAWGDPYKMSFRLIFILDRLRDFTGKVIVVHFGIQGSHSKNSWHPKGKAVDCHAEGMSLLDFYLTAERFPFGGIGVYPCWNHPGLHLDIRPISEKRRDPEARWGRIHNSYVPLNAEFIRWYVVPQR